MISRRQGAEQTILIVKPVLYMSCVFDTCEKVADGMPSGNPYGHCHTLNRVNTV
jgi:hypothetical protein